jgi:membrane fusion protein (multidrug efflux system)
MMGASACHSGKKDAPGKAGGPKQISVDAVVLVPKNLQNFVNATGTLLSNESVNVMPEISGKVTGIFFKEGQPVKQGELLVKIQDSDIRAQIQKLEATKKLNQTTLDRQKQLLDINGISRQEYDVTLSQIQTTEADIAYYKAQLIKTEIRAPFNGVAGLRQISLGAVISPSTLVTTIQQNNPLKLEFSVPEKYRDIARLNAVVRFSTSGSLDTFQAKVYAIDGLIDPATRTVKVRALFDNKGSKVFPGSFANVYFNMDATSDAIMVPSQAIIPGTRDKKVCVVSGGKANFKVVETGTRTEQEVQILSGVSAGDTIATTGILQLKQDMPVKIKKISSTN